MNDPGFHPACLLFPPLGDAEFAALVADIASRGLLHAAAVGSAAPPRGKATQFAARVASTNSAYVERAKRLRAECAPLVDAVRLGHFSLAEAGRLVRLPAAVCRQAMRLRSADPGRRMGDVLRECFAAQAPARLPARSPTSLAAKPNHSRIRIWCGDCVSLMRSLVDDASVDVVCTSPPYNVGAPYRNYDDRRPPAEFVSWLDEVFRELRRVLKPAGSLFVVAGHSPRHPWAAFEIARAAANHFVLQNQIAWVKSIAIEGRTRGHYRPVGGSRHLNRTWEQVFHFSTDGKAVIDRAAIGVVTADESNLVRHGDGSGVHCGGDAWFIPHETIRSAATRGGHPATFPVELAERCLRLAGCGRSSLVLDPFCGVNGMTAAARLGARGIGIDVDPDYCAHAAAAHGVTVEHRPRRPR